MSNLGKFMQELFQKGEYPDILMAGEDYDECALLLLKHFISNPDSLRNQMKLLRMDYVNTHTDIDIIKKYMNNIQKIAREILKRVSL